MNKNTDRVAGIFLWGIFHLSIAILFIITSFAGAGLALYISISNIGYFFLLSIQSFLLNSSSLNSSGA